MDMASAESFARDFLALEVITGFLNDQDVEDIVIDGLKPIFLHSTKGGFIKTDKKFSGSKELGLFIKKLIVFSGRNNIDTIGEIVNLELPDSGGRVNIVQSPFGPQLTITRAKLHPLSIIDLIDKMPFRMNWRPSFGFMLRGCRLSRETSLLPEAPGPERLPC